MIEPGSPVPDVTVLLPAGAPVRLPELAADGPFLLAFYLWDWTST